VPSSPGTRLGPYEIIGPLGAGGMGEVYRARDTRLDRAVAIKILPEHLATDPAFKARFEREARAVSALSHPHICTLHDIGEQAGVHFLVMELLQGETLAARLARGPMPPEESLQVASQICEALALAHRHGVVHRDLKPGNVMLTKTGAKLLDFGLAKQGAQAAPPLSSVVMTEASPLTAQGTIVGTWQYMSPEQLEGLEADARSDIFAFGAMLYEMMAGRRAFEARSQAGLIAAIMGTQPPGLSAVVSGASPALDRVLRRCLAKDPEDRWQSAADLASELKWIAQGSAATHVAAPAVSGVVVPSPASGPESPQAGARTHRGERLAWAIVTLALLAMIAALWARPFFSPAEPPRLITATLLPPAGATFDTRYAPAVSPDGRMVAAVVVGAEGKSSLYVRGLEREEMRKLPDSENAAHPFWSPDSRWIGFFAGDKLKKVDTAGGPALVLCDTQDGRGGSWSREGVIIFQPRFSDPLFKVSAGGGTPEPLTKLDEKQFHVAHRWPMFLPDGRRFLFYVVATTNPAMSEHSGIYLGSLDSPEIRQVLRVDSRMAYAQGTLLYKRGSTLMAQPFDPEQAKLTGDSLPLAAEVSGGSYSWGGADFGVSDQGVLAYRAGTGGGQTELTWIDRAGKHLGQIGGSDFYNDVRLSRDSLRVAVNIGRDAGDLWLIDLGRGVRTRFTFDPADDAVPVFSPDGTRVAFVSSRKGMGDLFWRDARGTGEEVLLFSSGTQLVASDWSPDGRLILLASLSRKTGFDLWTYSLEEKKAEPWLEGPLDQYQARISPNGRWIAYASDESGRQEVYVQTFPAKQEGRWQVSNGGGQPSWRSDGKEIYYQTTDGTMMAADVRTEGAFDVGTPHPLFKAQFKSAISTNYDVTPDGKRFLANVLKDSDRSGLSTTVVLNWLAALRK
jgi:Tol biopolymer transport system component